MNPSVRVVEELLRELGRNMDELVDALARLSRWRPVVLSTQYYNDNLENAERSALEARARVAALTALLLTSDPQERVMPEEKV